MKKGKYEKGIIIIGIVVALILLILLTADGIKNMRKNNTPIGLSEQEIIVPPNVPVLSAGMIPVKMMGDNLIISKNDNSWYSYEEGKPAYMMLNDGVYQSELLPDMTNKKLASENIGQIVPKEEQGTIYMWIPRFEINGEDKIKYVKDINYASEGYEIPETFMYKQEEETSPDFLLTGVWVEKTPLASESEVSTKITNMTGENNQYGFIANTVGVAMADEDKIAVGGFATNDVGAHICARIDTPSNTNRTILKILNDKNIDPIKAKVEYNKTTGLVETTITYSKYGINKITFEDTTELQMTNTDGIITATTEGITLEPGTYKIIITDKNGTAKRIKVKIPLEYGREVLGYECGVPNVKWRLFHADDNNIYLIADDYIPYANLPTSTNGTALNKGGTNYKAYFTNILNDYTGSSWIRQNTNEQAQKWLGKYLSTYPDSTNENMKAVAYMMDTESWSVFKGEKAEYAIGGPTLELFCASYKETHPSRYIECNSITSNGYNVKWSNDSYRWLISGLTQNDFNSIYIKSSTSRAYGTWIASSSAYNTDQIMYADYGGAIRNIGYNADGIGFRPVVCLKSGTKLLDNGDNTYSIKEPIMANIEYKEADGTIEITVRYIENGIAKIEDKNGNSVSYTNENGIIKAVVAAKGGRNKFTIIDNKGITKELEVTVVLPIYATLYKDGTLALTASDKVLEGKTVSKKFGNISTIPFTNYRDVPWYGYGITTVNIVDEIAPMTTAFWFNSCGGLANIDNMSNLDTSNVTSMNNMFSDCSSLTELDLSSLDTSSVTNMTGIFWGCSNLTKLNLSSFNTSNVTSMRSMFYYCNSLIKLDLSNFDTSNVTDMEGMFDNCNNLTELDVSSFNTSNVTSMRSMFYYCNSLIKLDVSNFDTSNVTDMEGMFNNCNNLTELDVSNFDTSNVTIMEQMFNNCKNLTQLDLSSFNTKKVTDMRNMFTNCIKLETIYVGENWQLADSTTNMFYKCGTSTTTIK